ncbi:MAG: GntR family transcriptional regulator [Eubacteriales bacterium]|nr:GntR family transcriptional regulator [Eubacteriales bacterium]
MIILDYHDRRPIYEQIVEKFRVLILRGAMPPGSRMPSVRQLAMELSINPNTIQRAYMTLEQEGLIYPVKGKGNFIADTEQIRKKCREDYYQEFRGVVRRGRELGIGEEELIYMIKDCYKEGRE